MNFRVGDKVVVDYKAGMSDVPDYRAGIVKLIHETAGSHTYFVQYEHNLQGEWWGPEYLIPYELFNSPLYKALS